jgi:putative oxidoreductase
MQQLVWAPLMIRFILASVFILHGGQKIAGGFEGMAKFAQWLGTMHIPALLAYAAIGAELLGGIAIGLGIATEVAAAVIAIDMAFAIILVHWQHGFFIQNSGYEYALTLLLLCIALIMSGPGKWYLWDPFTGR